MTPRTLLVGALAVLLYGCKGDSQPKMTLLEAAEANNKDEIVRLVNSGADVNAVDKATGSTPLLLVAGRGNVELANLLIEKGAKLDSVNKRGYNAVLIAVGNNDVEMTKTLKEKGADLNAKSKQGYTAFYIAKMYKHKEMMEYLKTQGVDTSDPKLNITRKAPTRG